MSERAAGCVVVGVDPAWRVDDVVRAAAAEALRRDASLVIVAVARRSNDPRRSPGGMRADDRWTESGARHALVDAYDAVGPHRDEVPTSTVCLWEDEVSAERDPLARADLLVLGSRGHHGRVAFGLGSVSRALLKAVHCPVLAVPAGVAAAPSGAVVVGLGDHPWDRTVLRTAAAEAVRRGADLQVMHAYVPRFDETLSRGIRRAEDLVAQASEGLDPGPGTTVSVLLTQESPATALLTQAEGAALVVVGSRPGALSGLLLDSVSRALLEAAPCPVLVVQRGEPVPDVVDVAEPVGERARVERGR